MKSRMRRYEGGEVFDRIMGLARGLGIFMDTHLDLSFVFAFAQEWRVEGLGIHAVLEQFWLR